MARATGLSQAQLTALARLKPLAEGLGLHLVGGSAIAVHLGHRRSVDLDLFSLGPGLDLERVRRGLIVALPSVRIIDDLRRMTKRAFDTIGATRNAR